MLDFTQPLVKNTELNYVFLYHRTDLRRGDGHDIMKPSLKELIALPTLDYPSVTHKRNPLEAKTLRRFFIFGFKGRKVDGMALKTSVETGLPYSSYNSPVTTRLLKRLSSRL